MLMAIALIVTMAPVYADWSAAYLDVTGTYLVSSNAGPREMDGDRHPRVGFNRLIITTQVDKEISLATLEHLGTDIDLDGIVGPGTRPESRSSARSRRRRRTHGECIRSRLDPT